jgi:hypothetical protein
MKRTAYLLFLLLLFAASTDVAQNQNTSQNGGPVIGNPVTLCAEASYANTAGLIVLIHGTTP